MNSLNIYSVHFNTFLSFCRAILADNLVSSAYLFIKYIIVEWKKVITQYEKYFRNIKMQIDYSYF